MAHQFLSDDWFEATEKLQAELNPEVPESLQWILNKCLNKDPSQRYQDSRDLAVDLRHVLTDSGSQRTAAARARTGRLSAQVAPAPIWRQPVFVGGAVLMVLLAAIFLPRLFRGGGISVPPASASGWRWPRSSSSRTRRSPASPGPSTTRPRPRPPRHPPSSPTPQRPAK